jgi:hypothetical protein
VLSGCQVQASARLPRSTTSSPMSAINPENMDASEVDRVSDPTTRTRTRSSLTPAALPRPHRVRHAPACHDAIRGSCRVSTSYRKSRSGDG